MTRHERPVWEHRLLQSAHPFMQEVSNLYTLHEIRGEMTLFEVWTD